MDFTRDELFEYFSDRYTSEQVTDALTSLGEDPNAEGYPASITDRLEQVFKVVTDAIASSKQLPGANLATVEQTAVQLAGDRSIDVTPDLIRGMLDILGAQAAVEAYAIHQHKKTIREGVLSQLQVGELAETNQVVAERIDALQKLVNDPETLDQILNDYGLLSQSAATEQRDRLTADSEFNPDAFLMEVGAKKPQVQAIAHTKSLAKTLLFRALK